MKDLLKNIQSIHIILLVIWIFCFISAILQPSLNDAPVFWNWARLVSESNLDGMDAIESVWEIKGLLSRFIYYQLYLLTSIFTSSFYPTGHYVYTAIGLTEITAIIAISLYILPIQYMNKSYKRLSFFVATIAIFTSSAWSNMQPEIWGYALLLLSFCILLRDDVTSKILGGVLLGFLFFLKTPFILLSGCVFFAYALITNRRLIHTIKAIWIYACAALLTIFAILLLLYILYPIEIYDMFVLPSFYGNLFSLSPVEMLQAYSGGGIQLLQLPLHVPVVLVGAISLFMYLASHRKVENIFILCMWLFPYLYIVISNKYFIYHYNVMLFPSIISIYLTRVIWRRLSLKAFIILIIIGIVMGCVCSNASFYVLFTILLPFIIAIPYVIMAMSLVDKWRTIALYSSIFLFAFVFASFQSGFSYASRTSQSEVQKMVDANLAKGYPIGGKIGDESILHISDGIEELWVGNKSYLRYFYPVPLTSSSFMESEKGGKMQDTILNYRGEYLTLSDDYDRYLRKSAPNIADFIEENYYLVDTIYQVYSLFRLYDKHPIGRAEVFIFQKK